jgi:hypothetical protein
LNPVEHIRAVLPAAKLWHLSLRFNHGDKQMNISSKSTMDEGVKPSAVQRQSSTPSVSHRKISLAAGLFYLLTFVSIPTLALYTQVKNPDYVTGAGPDTPMIIGGILEVIVALAGIATAVILFKVLKRQNEVLALGLVAARVLEASTIFQGVAFLDRKSVV